LNDEDFSDAMRPDYEYDIRQRRAKDYRLRGYKIEDYPRLASSCFFLNPRKAYFQDRKKRLGILKVLHAISAEVNTESRSGTPLHDVFPRGMIGHQDSPTSFAKLETDFGSVTPFAENNRLVIAGSIYDPDAFARRAKERFGINVEIRPFDPRKLYQEIAH